MSNPEVTPSADRDLEPVFVALVGDQATIDLTKLDPVLEANSQIIVIHATSFKGVQPRSPNPAAPEQNQVSDGIVKAILEKVQKEVVARRSAINKFVDKQNEVSTDFKVIPLVIVLRGIIESANDAVDLGQKGISILCVCGVHDGATPLDLPTASTRLVHELSKSIPEICSISVPTTAMDTELLKNISEARRSLRQYRSWRDGVQMVSFPGPTVPPPLPPNRYQELMDTIPFMLHSPESVLFGMFEQVDAWVEAMIAFEAETNPGPTIPTDHDPRLVQYFEEAWVKLTQPGTDQERSSIALVPEIVSYGDCAARRQAYQSVNSNGAMVNTDLLFQAAKLRFDAIPVPLPIKTNQPQSEVERGAFETQMLSFTSMPIGVFYHSLRVDGFDRLMEMISGNQPNDRKWDIHGRQYRESLTANELAYLFSSLTSSPAPAQYRIQSDVEEGVLRLAIHINTPHIRSSIDSWECVQCGDLTLSDWMAQRPSIRDKRQAALVKDRRTVTNLIKSSRTVYPADKGLMGAITINSDVILWVLLRDVFLSTFKSGPDKFQLRVRMASDNSELVLGGGYCRSIAMDGNQYEIDFSGAVTCLYTDRHQEWKRISPQGIITRRFADGHLEVMCPDGAVAISSINGSWTTTQMNGCVSSTNTECDEICVVSQIDPESSAVITTRADGVMSIAYENGDILYVFRDGSRTMVSKTHIRVDIPGAITVTIDHDHRAVSVKAQMQPTMRLNVATPSIEITSSCQEYKFICRPDRVVFVPDCQILVPDDWATRNHIERCYLYNEGKLSTMDGDDNMFMLGLNGEYECKLRMEMNNIAPGSGPDPIPIRYYAPPEDPIEPRLFLVKSDGSGLELMRSREVAAFQNRSSSDPETVVLEPQNFPVPEEGRHFPCVYKYQKKITKRKQFMTSIKIPNIVRAGAGCSTVLEWYEHLARSGFILQRTLVKYVPTSEVQQRQAVSELESFNDDLEKYRKIDARCPTTVDHRSSYEIQEQTSLQKELVEIRKALPSRNAHDADDTTKPSEPRPDRARSIRATIPTENVKPNNYFHEPSSIRNFALEQAVQRIANRQRRGQRLLSDTVVSTDDQALALQALDEIMLCLSRIFEPGSKNKPELRRVDLTRAPYSAILTRSNRLKTHLPQLLETLGLIRDDQTFTITGDLKPLELAVDFVVKEGIRLSRQSIPVSASERAAPALSVDAQAGKTSDWQNSQTTPTEKQPIVLRSPSPDSFAAREAIARRRLRTTATIKAAACNGELRRSFFTENGSLVAFALMRIEPTEAFFGTLNVGYTYRVPIRIFNVGVEAGRFSIDQPPGTTNIRVVNNLGPIAPGLASRVEIEIYTESKGQINTEFVIRTELDTIKIPITAEILESGPEISSHVRVVCKGQRKDVLRNMGSRAILESPAKNVVNKIHS